MFKRARVLSTPPQILEVNIGTRLRELRKQANMTQVQLALASGVQQGEITGYENDKRVPTAPKVAALAKALKVPMEVLIGDVEIPQPLASTEPRPHGNSTPALTQRIIQQLTLENQRAVLAHAKALLTAQEAQSTSKRSNQAA